MKITMFSTAALSVIITICLQFSVSCKQNESIIIVALPLIASNEPVVTSYKREEILSGAILATEEINNDSSLSLSSVSLSLVDTGNYNQAYYPGNVLEVIANLTWQKRFKCVVGIAGILFPNILHILQKFRVPVVSLTNFGEKTHIPNVTYMTASTSTLADSVLAFIKMLNQSDIGIITKVSYSHYFIVSKEIYDILLIPMCHSTSNLVMST